MDRETKPRGVDVDIQTQIETAEQRLPADRVLLIYGGLYNRLVSRFGRAIHNALVADVGLMWIAQEAGIPPEVAFEEWMEWALGNVVSDAADPIEDLHEASQRLCAERDFLRALLELKHPLPPRVRRYVAGAVESLRERGDWPPAG